MRAVAEHAGVTIERIDGRLCDHAPASGFVLLHSFHPHDALAACSPDIRDDLAARVVALDVSRSRIFTRVLEGLRLAAAVDAPSHLAWTRAPQAHPDSPACGLYGLRSIAAALGVTCEPSAGESEHYGFLTSAKHAGLPHLADYLAALAASRRTEGRPH